MNKTMRLFILVLCILLSGAIAAHAEMVTVGISLTGVLPAEDGSVRTVRPEGKFRVYQNGEEVGVIEAGRGTVTIDTTERIRIEPIPQSFTPEWDLSGAYVTPELKGAGAQMIPVTVTLLGEKPQGEEPTAAAQGTENTEPETAETEASPATETEAPASEAPQGTEIPEINAPAPDPQASAPTPTIPPYTQEITETPEPVLPGLAAGNGTLRVQVFFDKNGNGNQGDYEYGIPEIPVYLLNEAEEPLCKAQTDADGFAVFEHVPDGRYKTRVNLPDEWFFSQFGGENSLTLNAYTVDPAGSQTSGTVKISAGREAVQGIGIRNKATSMSGFCWLEETVDGLYTDGEVKLPGIVIRLRHQNEDIVYETVTGEDGSWKIDHLHPGYYSLSASAPEGLMLTRYTQNPGKRSYLTSDHPRRQVEAGGEDKTNMNLGFNWSAQVFGRCYLDANYNGQYDEGELPLPGVKLSVKYMYDSAEASAAVSGEDGTFVLDGLRGNQYWISVILPDDGSVYTKLAADLPLGNLFPPRGDRRDNSLRNYILEDAERRELNIGAVYPGTVTGTVYYDDNFSAAPDKAEKTVSNFVVTIRDTDGNTAVTARTNANGVYELTGLTPGEYTLEVTAVSGYAFTKAGDGNVILNRTGGQGYSEPFRVELGEKVSGKDIGMIQPGTVKGTVFADRNDNGLQDEGEGGFTGATVRLMSETEGEAFRAEIGADGGFLFDAVMPGRYYLEYELPERAVFARNRDGGNRISGEGNTGRTESFSFATGEVREAPLCGALTLGRIGGCAYQDHDGNGIMENEETLAGWSIRLIPSRNELETVSAVTGEDGAFLLDGLRPDTYQLEVTCPEGYVLSRTDHLNLPLTAGKNAQAVSLELPMGREWTGLQAGAVLPAALGGQVWLDENNNGLFDEDERTPAGYRISITDEATGKVFDTPVTDEDGCFYSAGMIPGSFTVSLAMDETMLAPKDGDSVFHEKNGALTLEGIRLQENETRNNLLMGVVRYTSVSGHAWIDRGEQTEDLAGVKVVMRDSDGNEIARAETDGSGRYRIGRLMPCAFRLEVTAPEGCVIIEPDDPRLTDTRRSVIAHPSNRLGSTDLYELKMAEDLETMDVGCVLPGRIGDYCWVDLNRDGLQDGSEPGLPNLRIELLRDGQVIAETVSDQYGFYRFVDLYPATYTLRVTVPQEVKPTRRRQDLPMIASVLQESDEVIAYSIPLTVVSDRSNYNADLGFECLMDGVLPAGAGEGRTQVWTPKY